jgi:hypothetical protein
MPYLADLSVTAGGFAVRAIGYRAVWIRAAQLKFTRTRCGVARIDRSIVRGR